MKLKMTLPSVEGFAAESAAEHESTVKVGFRVNCKDYDPDLRHNLATTFLDEYIYPNVMKQVKQKLIPSHFKFFKAHLIMSDDPEKNKLLLNDDVRFIGLVRLTKKNRKRGDPILMSEIEDVLGIYPSNKNDPNSAHIMLFKFKGEWLISCDLFYNKQKNRVKLDNAKAFLKAGTISLNQKLYGPFVDNLYSATELGIQSILLFHPMKKFFPKRQNHYQISKMFQNYAKLGNLDIKYLNNFNKLAELRSKGRYLNGLHGRNFALKPSISDEILRTAENFIDYVDKSIKSLDFISNIPNTEYLGFGKNI